MNCGVYELFSTCLSYLDREWNRTDRRAGKIYQRENRTVEGGGERKKRREAEAEAERAREGERE